MNRFFRRHTPAQPNGDLAVVPNSGHEFDLIDGSGSGAGSNNADPTTATNSGTTMSATVNTNGAPRNAPRDKRALIQLNNVVKAYQTPVGEFIALRGINLTIGRGEFVAVVGK